MSYINLPAFVLGSIIVSTFIVWHQKPNQNPPLRTKQRTPERVTPVVRAIARVGPSVVSIYATEVLPNRIPTLVPSNEEFFREYLGPFPRNRELQRHILGSGVVVDKQGYIITNAHVVAGATKIEVALINGSTYKADLLSVADGNDLALLKIDPPSDLRAITIGSSSDLMIGETVIAIGNPFGLRNSVSMGILSATGRIVRELGKFIFFDFLQVDASINPGNSGGPLINIKGEMIGINTAIYREGSGIGFVIPVNRVRDVLQNLLETSNHKRIWFGAEITDAGTGGGRVRVTGVEKNSPAEEAGLVENDVILSINGRVFSSALEFQQIVIAYDPGNVVTITVVREGKKVDLKLTLRQQPKEVGQLVVEERLGACLTPIPDDDHKSGTGVLIQSVEPGSPADKIGIIRGDVIIKLGRRESRALPMSIIRMRNIKSVKDVISFISEVETVGQIIITITRDGEEMTGEMMTR